MRAMPTCVALTCVALFTSDHGFAEDMFYAGKTITISTHGGIAGSYDIYARMLAAHIGKHLPGNPSVIVINQPGAGGLTAYNFAAKAAPRDGTFFTLVSQGLPIVEALGGPGLQVSLKDMQWIGNFTQSNTVTISWNTSPVKTLDQAKEREVVVGSSGAGSISSQIPVAYNHLLGTRFKVIYGYEGGAQMNVAMQRGELDGRATNTWASYKNELPNDDWKKLNVLIQIGLKKEPELPNVPLLMDLVRADPQKEAIASFLSLALAIGRPVAAPPGVPAERVALLRKAFDETLADPDFLKASQVARLEVDPMGGEDVQKIVAQVLATPPAVVEATKTVLEMHDVSP
ncbi:MAG TPA: tripartite tricarboxylate transporter substrate-binding protein [Beijerinckiaceae bacterium]|nr:tripartite tricarboxylate transporter substrate-binding protein [Beijerinckiaceae bacterium]